MSTKLDPHSEEEYWNTIKQRKIQIPITVNEQGEVNLAPLEPHLKVVCISDTHEQLDSLTVGLNQNKGIVFACSIHLQNVPDGDVLIHAGDFTNFGSEEEVRKFNKQMERFPHKYKLVVAGNHELGFDDTEVIEDRLEIYKGLGTKSGYHLLTSIENVRFYGSSWHPLPGYPFSVPRTRLAKYWSTIPSDTDVLITHSPPLGMIMYA
uniref:Metallophos domain-containing protein n=1 Tax=Heterorhabditis bacteriophora TaxID=37862 RepID=A0A1I7XLP4_HETBA